MARHSSHRHRQERKALRTAKIQYITAEELFGRPKNTAVAPDATTMARSNKKQQRQRLQGHLLHLSDIAFWILLGLIGLALLISSFLYLQIQNNNDIVGWTLQQQQQQQQPQKKDPPHLYPPLPFLPAFPSIANAEQLIHQVLYDNQPTIAGIAAILYQFLEELHRSNIQLTSTSTHADLLREIQTSYFKLVQKHLLPLEKAYRNRPVFEIRQDESIFVSIAAFREHLLADTLRSLFENAAHPEKLFVGVIVNNCFDDGQCQGGVKVVGTDPNTGKDILEPIHGSADTNHIATFCQETNSTLPQYCKNGQVRVLYIRESEALGPAMARYYSSKLWGGETYYVQIDSHLQFAQHWDELYFLTDLKLCQSYPKAILSTYPPGFVNFRPHPPFTPGTRLCKCQLRAEEGYLPRVEMQGRCKEGEPRPTQMAFLGAGFFFTSAEFLVDVPFDPFLPWLFMGEEIALSIRAWTSGWNIYAPRKNLIGHQYRPISMGTPHYQDTLGRFFHRPGLVSRAQEQIRNRIKYMLGYPKLLEGKNLTKQESLLEAEHYGLGKERSREEYLQFAEIDLEEMTCGPMKWCIDGTLE